MTPNQLIIPLVTKIVQKDIKRLKDELDNLIEENHILGNPQHGFMYAGHFHSNLHPRAHLAAIKKPISLSLVASADRYLTDKQALESNQNRMIQGMSILVRSCRTLQDLRDALPEVLKSILPQISSLPRTRPEAYTLKDKPLQMRDYATTEDLVAFYMANQLLY